MSVERGLRVTLITAWTVLLLLQPGSAFDEGEHAHAAWLMARLGMRPLRDFFEHHPPLLWQVIGVWFRVGGDGPEALIFARTIAVLCVLAFVLTLWRLGGRAAALVIVVVALLAPTLFVSRPESLALGFFAAALFCWSDPLATRLPRGLAALVAGALLGLAVVASPRFVLLLPALALVGGTLVRVLALITGAVVAPILYLLLGGATWRELAFDVAFSAELQRVGSGPPLYAVQAAGLLGLALLPAVVVLHRTEALRTRRGQVSLIWLLATSIACAVSAGRFLYPQAFLPAVVAGVVLLAAAEAPLRPAETSARRHIDRTLMAVLVLALAATLGWLAVDVATHRTLPEWVAVRRALLDYARRREPNGVVMASPVVHPIAFRDASYYGMPLLDGSDRLCRAVRSSRWTARLPPCDPAADIATRRPLVIDRRVIDNLPSARRAALAPLLRADYGAAGSFLLRVEHAAPR